MSRAFRASLEGTGLISVTLEHSDLQDNVTEYAAQLTGEPRAALATFANASGGQVTFRASLHGAIYSVGLLLQQEGELGWSPPVRTLTLLTSKITHPLFISLSLALYLYPTLSHSLFHTFSVSVSLTCSLSLSIYVPISQSLSHSLSLSVSL